ncbi:MAG TPA: TetR family transcriptional regulator [Rugosimonospora sp.]|nr:TetR family transcriptional regulator [Rugosimonospora sp.]
MSGSSSLRERKKQKTRWLIQEHALRLFREQGYEQTTVDQIAAAAEISPSTFFRYFKTKEDVVLEDEYDPMLLAGLAAAPAEMAPVPAMRYAMRQAFGQIDQTELPRLLERTRLTLSVPALRMRTLDNFTGQFELLGGPLAARYGRSTRDFDIRVLVGAIFGAIFAAVLTWVERDGGDDLMTLMDDALAQIESAGLATADAPAAP